MKILQFIRRGLKESSHKLVVVPLVWLGMGRALVRGSDGENIKHDQVGSHRVRMEQLA